VSDGMRFLLDGEIEAGIAYDDDDDEVETVFLKVGRIGPDILTVEFPDGMVCHMNPQDLVPYVRGVPMP
jgi:hypothetical protein